MRFDNPVGTPAERDQAAWPGTWIDATGFATLYTDSGGGRAYHTGADLNNNAPHFDADAHGPVYASADGVVTFAAFKTVWGNVVTIKHVTPDGPIWTRYGHVEKMLVKAGDVVARGQQIASVGKPEPARAPYHLHFDVARVDLGVKPGDWPGADLARLKKDYIDPKAWINTHRVNDGGIVAVSKWTPTSADGTRVRFTPDTTSVENVAGVIAFGQQVDGEKTSDGKWITVKIKPERITINGAPLAQSALGTFAAYASAQYMKPVTVAPPIPQPPPVVVPPPATKGKFQLGPSVLISHHLLEPAYAAGCRAFLIMEGLLAAVQFKQAHPDALVMYRKYIGRGYSIPDPNLFRGEAKMGNGVVFVTPLNECDGPCYGSPGEIEQRAKFDTALGQMCRDNGTIYAAGGFSMGTPDFTRPDICEAMRKFYAPGYNAGTFGMNMHLYSPNMGWIYGRTRTIGDVDRELALESLHPRDDGVSLYAVGRNGDVATVGTLDNDGSQPIGTRSIGEGDQRIWFERRWEFLFTKCGFDPDPNLVGIYCDETGVDEGGVGGFPAHNASAEDVCKWSVEFKKLSETPLVIGGKSYPSPMRGAAVFQAGHQDWKGYDVSPYFREIGSVNS